MGAWTTNDSLELYNVGGWGRGLFGINQKGHLIIEPKGEAAGQIDVKQVVDDLVRRGLSMPLLLRFSDLLGDSLGRISGAFNQKIQEYSFRGDYLPVMPIKVNQQRHVLEELLEFSKDLPLGLEAGSKPELLIAITLLSPRGGLIVCNGYKDDAYIETALLAERLGLTTLIIIDRFAELSMIIKASKRLGIKPLIGIRAKLSSKGSGKWAESGGDQSKFGLTASEMVASIEHLTEAGLLDQLVCLHFHIGSQVTAIRAIKDALREGSRIYTNLYRMGAPLRYFDVGGGLAVDYDGSKTNFHASKNYSLSEYAADVVYSIASTLDAENIPHPTIISESGRALVAHHSVLVFDVLGQHESRRSSPLEHGESLENDEPEIIQHLRETCQSVTRKNYQELYHDAIQLKEDGLSMFRHGLLDLRQRALLEELFWATAHKIWRVVKELDYVPEDLAGLQKQLADTYYCNFSVFQSVPDVWAVDHLFPVMPIHRLDERPNRRGVLADLTCDSDGKIDKFIDLNEVKNTLELHEYTEGEPYFLGIFLVGAYQEVLGDLHNLFGDVNAIHIGLDKEAGYSIRNVVSGDTIKDVLSYVQYDPATMLAQLRQAIENALRRGKMSFEESAALVRHFEASLAGYTYLEQSHLAETLLAAVVPVATKPETQAQTSPRSADIENPRQAQLRGPRI